MDNVEKRLEMLDQRLDNIDSIVTALVERIMKQPVTVQLTCPKCGAEVQIMMTSTAKTIGKVKSQ
jgi:predicted RNA-binding Zn-ribbon protein involved in translation (DUF1610 family)